MPNETERLDVELAAGEHHDPVVESLGHVVVRRRAVGSKARADSLSPSNGRAPPPPYAEMGTLADAYVTLYGTKVQCPARVGRENRGVEDRRAGQCLETTVMKAKTVVAVIGVTLLAAAGATTTDEPERRQPLSVVEQF